MSENKLPQELVRDEAVVLDLNQETHDVIKEEYEKVAGINQEPKEEKNDLGFNDKSLEAFITDPSLILKDFKDLCQKHNIGFADLLSEMGFNIKTLKAVIINKPILEQIYTLNRRFSTLIYRMGVLSGSVDDGFSTMNIRMMLGEVTHSKEWLDNLDQNILPFIAYFQEHGTIDKEFFVKDEEQSSLEELAKEVTSTFTVNREIMEEVELANKVSEDILTGRDSTGHEDVIELDHGGDTVGEYSEEQVEEAQEVIEKENS